jgi:hypothetical protein
LWRHALTAPLLLLPLLRLRACGTQPAVSVAAGVSCRDGGSGGNVPAGARVHPSPRTLRRRRLSAAPPPLRRAAAAVRAPPARAPPLLLLLLAALGGVRA